MYQFNPFSKPFQAVTAEDLGVLRAVAEGWFVEYKRTGLDTRDMAKHLSAFANQYGGWLFFGVEEAADGSRMAAAFPGLPREDIPALSLRIREAVSAHLSPPAFYEERIVSGPCEAIGLPEGRAILILGIPQGQDPPYVHSTGRIYRRLADQSKPHEESDRHVLDRLWERGRVFREKTIAFLRQTPELPQNQADSTWAFITLVPDLRMPGPSEVLPFETFRQLATNEGDILGRPSMPLQQVGSAPSGYIARQVDGNNPQFATPGFRFWHDGVARLELPVNVWSIEDFRREAAHYKHAKAFLLELESQRHAQAQICDFSRLVTASAALANLYLHIREKLKDERRLYAAVELRNLFYRVPFLDSAQFIARCKSHRIPLMTYRTVVLPEEPYFDSMLELKPRSGARVHPEQMPYLLLVTLLGRMLISIGVVADHETFPDDIDLWLSPTDSR